MPTITADRKGEFVRTALQVLADNDGHLPAREVFKETEKRLKLTEYEKPHTKKAVISDGNLCSIFTALVV